MAMTMTTDTRSFSELLSDAVNKLTALVRSEIQLARAELTAKVGEAAVGLAMLAVSASVMIAALVLLLMALAGWLVHLGLTPPLADFFAALVGAVIGAVIAWNGISRLKADNLAPKRTLEQLHRDASTAKELVK
jgi:hypothetical protein